MVLPRDCVVPLHNIDHEDTYLVGEEATHLGELIRKGIPIIPGAVVTKTAFKMFLADNGLDIKIEHLLSQVNPHHHEALSQVVWHIKTMINQGQIPENILSALKIYGYERDVAGAMLKSSWTSHIQMEKMYLRPQLDTYAFDRPILIRKLTGGDLSGKVHTMDTHIYDKSKVVIDVKSGYSYVIDKEDKTFVTRPSLTGPIIFVKDGINQSLGHDRLGTHEMMYLTDIAIAIERHFYFPQVIEWVKESDRLFITGIKPVTAVTPQTINTPHAGIVRTKVPILVGSTLNHGIATGVVRRLKHATEMHKVKSSDILVAKFVTRDFLGNHRMAALISEDMGPTSNSAAFARKLGIPAVSIKSADHGILKNGDVLSVNGKTGEIFRGGFLVN